VLRFGLALPLDSLFLPLLRYSPPHWPRSLSPLAFSSHDFIALICLRNLVFPFSAASAARDAYSAPAFLSVSL